MIGPVEWTERYCEICDDAPSFRHMKALAAADILKKQDIVDELDRHDDPGADMFKEDIESLFKAFEKLDARQGELGFDQRIPHGYGLTPQQIVEFEALYAEWSTQK